jgi:F-type H+-transporting ATPase subunit b
MDKLASLGIDFWSIVLYMVNTGVLLFVLTKYFYKPILNFVDERRKQIADSINEAHSLRAEFQNKLDEAEASKRETEASLRTELANLRKFTEQKRTEMITEMDAARSEMMRKAQEEIDRKKASILKEAEKDVMALITRIVLHIVENKVPENVIQDSISSAWKTYTK